jgi:hypothetical protein
VSINNDCEGCGAHWMQNCTCNEVLFEAVSMESYKRLELEIEKLKKQNEECAMLVDHIGNLVEEKAEFFWLGDNVHSAYFENMPIFEMARQALKDAEEIKTN